MHMMSDSQATRERPPSLDREAITIMMRANGCELPNRYVKLLPVGRHSQCGHAVRKYVSAPGDCAVRPDHDPVASFSCPCRILRAWPPRGSGTLLSVGLPGPARVF